MLIKEGVNLNINGELLPEFSTILIEGSFRIYDTEENPLKVQNIIIAPTGKLIIGTKNEPIDQKRAVEIHFVKNSPGEIGIFVFGELQISGDEIGPTFVEVTGNARPGDKFLTVKKIMKDWQAGDEVVITTPGTEFGSSCHIEESEISSIIGVFIELLRPLNCSHVGELEDDEEIPKSHISNLSRNVLIKSENTNYRGSVNFFHGSTGHISYAEFRDLGPQNVLGRYPIHFHHMQDTSRGIEVTGNSIINSENRWVTVHDSNGVIIKNNVGYQSRGHGFFLEDGHEFDNVFENNIGILTFNGNLVDSDNRASVFWFQNPQNYFSNNVAVGGSYYGFWFDIPDMQVILPDSGDLVHLRALPTLEFKDNIAYANKHAGLLIERGMVMVNDENVKFSNYTISGMVIWGVSDKYGIPDNSGILIEGHNIGITDSKILDSPIGIALSGSNNIIKKTIILNNNPEAQPSFYGVLIGGWDNEIHDSMISGFTSYQDDTSSDIALSNEIRHEVSVTIYNTSMMDLNPINFGNPFDEKSSITVYGYNAPNALNEEFPINFIMKKISNTSEINDESIIIDPKSGVVVEQISAQTNTEYENKNQFEDCIDCKSKLLEKFKIKVKEWRDRIISDEDLLYEINILKKGGIIQSDIFDLNYFEDYHYILPDWIKILATFWVEDKISDNEFVAAMQYLIKVGIIRV